MMASKFIKILVTSLENEGCTVRQTKKGYLIQFPNGESTTFHKTLSDHRALLNIRAYIRRNGCSWPFDSLQQKNEKAS